MRIESLRKFNGRNPNGYFCDLSPQARMAAWRWLGKFQQRWGRNMPRWRFGILVGQAKRLGLMSGEERSAWGRSMLAKRGGHAVQRRYRLEGRNSTSAATKARQLRVKHDQKAATAAESSRRARAAINSMKWKV